VAVHSDDWARECAIRVRPNPSDIESVSDCGRSRERKESEEEEHNAKDPLTKRHAEGHLDKEPSNVN
jgi:hypothetical protein